MIIKLHENLINKIAAGEVVERPASVVKELIENSIDAKADKITLNIEKAGIELIEVIDNGKGMSKVDAKLATNSHTTSKISSMQDLESVYTMGFRGEALASISSVSHFTLITKESKSKSGTKITLKGGKEKKVEKTSANDGTKITVKNLFYNVPARRKFLKTERTEYKHILKIFQNYAIAFPHIHFILTHNKKNVYNLPSNESDNFNEEVKVRIDDIYQKEISENLIPLKYNSPILNISGFLGHPKISRSRNSKQSIFLNRRPVSDKLISKAIYVSYHTLIPKGEYPIFFVFLKINPELIDVNVHPRKLEVRFSNSQEIFKSIKNSTRQSLLKFLQQDVKNAVSTFNKGDKPKTFKSKLKNYRKYSYSKDKPSKKDISQSVTFTKSLLREGKKC